MRLTYIFILFFSLNLQAQEKIKSEIKYTYQDTLRGSITPERIWWDLTYYDLEITVQPKTKTIFGKNAIQYKTLDPNNNVMQIDLQTAYQNYEAKVGDMTPVMRQIEEKKIMDKEQRLQKRNQDFQMELQAYANELNGPILKRIQDAVSKVAESKKLNYVIDETVTLYFAGGIDITDEVIAEVMKEEAKLKSAAGTN